MEFERIQKRICRHKMSIMFNEICINEEMLPKYTYIYIYTYITLKCAQKGEKIIDRKINKSISIPFNRYNTLFEDKTNKRYLLSVNCRPRYF